MVEKRDSSGHPPKIGGDADAVERWRRYWLEYQRAEFEARLAMCVTAIHLKR